jgi:predicted nuclease of predicted toxin-antitoxin system
MKLLLDQNLSPRLIQRLADLYPGSIHVEAVGLDRALDNEVWLYTKDNGLTIVSKDADFNELSLIWGFPPKVIWIQRGNCSTKAIEAILRDNYKVVKSFIESGKEGTLVLF